MVRVAMTPWDTTHIDSLRTGGLERCMLSEAASLSAQGVHVRIATSRFDGPRGPYSVQEIKPSALLGRRSFMGYYARFVVGNLSAGVLHAHNSPFVAALCPSKTLVHLHNQVYFPGYRKICDRYRAAHYACCSRFMRSWLLRAYPGLDPGRVHVLYNGVDVMAFKPIGGKAGGDRPLRLLFAGQWDERKGIFLLLEAMDRLLDGGTRFELCIAGSAGLWRGRANEALAPQTEARVYGWASTHHNVHIVGAVSHDQMPQLYRSADVMVMPSIWDEPLGIVALEAMASGLPVVAFPVGGIPEVVVDGETGLLVPERTPVALAGAIASLMHDPERIRCMGRAGRARVQRWFSWEQHMAHLWRLYRTVDPKLEAAIPVQRC